MGDVSPAATRSSTMFERVLAWMFHAEDAGGLAVYRIAWGSLLAWESSRYIQAGWVRQYYVAPNFFFKYVGFEWVHPLPGQGMIYLYYGIVVAGICVSLGFYYRLSSVVLFIGHAWAFLAAASNYLNHAYLIVLVAFIMIWLPAGRTLSVDAWRRRDRALSHIPRWPRALLASQFALVYIYGGIAKLNTDWLVYHQPIRRWMAGSAKRIPWAHDAIASEWFTQLVAYGGTAFDLLIVPALLWRKTRVLAVISAASFHVTNSYLFSIGVFPWLGIAATTLFLAPSFPRRIPKLGAHIGRMLDRAGGSHVTSPVWRRRVAAAVGGWLLIQVLIPLRHHLYPSDVAWSEDGHYCSWRMKLRSKKGSVSFRVVEISTGRTWTVDGKNDLAKRQVSKMHGKPELIRQYANHLVERYKEEEGIDVNVYVDAFASLNYRPSQRLIDPLYELGHESASLGPYRWVTDFHSVAPPHPGAPPKAR